MTLERIIVTGSEGFLGRALCDEARRRGILVQPVDVLETGSPGLVRLDLRRDPGALAALVDDFRPRALVHAAWCGSPGTSLAENLIATESVIGAALGARCAFSLLSIGSAAEYGDQGAAPIPESAPERPVSAYGVFKLAQGKLVLLSRQRGIRASVARLFNLIGPAMPARLAPAQFATQLRRLRAGEVGAVEVGDLSCVRDYLEVSEAARAILDLLRLEQLPDVVNVCSGSGVRMSAMLEEMASQLGTVAVVAATRPAREPAVTASVGSTEKLAALLGRRPSFELSSAVRRLLSA